MAQSHTIAFKCAVAKVQTLADGALRVWIDLPEDETFAAAQLIACQTHGVYLDATLEPIEENSGRTQAAGRRKAKRRD